MRHPKLLRSALLASLLAGNLVTGPGCGESGPPTGTMGSPVNEVEAAKQKQATEEGYKALMKKAKMKQAGRR